MKDESYIQERSVPIYLGKSQKAGNVRFAQPLAGELAERIYQAVRDRKESEFSETRAFPSGVYAKTQGYWGFDNVSRVYDGENNPLTEERGVIIGSSCFLASLADEELSKYGLSLPSLEESRYLGARNLFPKIAGGYRDIGILLSRNSSDNGKLQEDMISQAESMGLRLPLVLAFRNLRLRRADTEYGASFDLVNEEDIVSGEEARESISKLWCSNKKGVQRITRFNDGRFVSEGPSISTSYKNRIMDWVVGEAPLRKLKDLADKRLDSLI